ncbi:SAM-dependent methyltransferase [Rugosimonospora acidiphila]|uniref:SAM-dependent methyltransferase n=1 Tax=Rugosimonospora acidiphila TaxID=556531 RepID=A0ABP9SGC7_9ACTN
MDPEYWARDIDPNVPSAARMYDYFLGGSHNFEADREAARRVIEAMPQAPLIARANRSFLRRAVRFLVASGVRQFLDIGSGVPTVGNVHEIAQGLDPDARVVYVDIDPVAISHAQQLLEGNTRATAIVADLRRPAELLDLLRRARTRAVLDLSRPVGLLMVSMLHFLPGEGTYRAAAALRDALAPGSHVVVSHPVSDAIDARAATEVEAVYRRTATPGGLRTRAEVQRFFDGYALVPPGLVWVPEWRPDDRADNAADDDGEPGADPRRVGMVAGVGGKTG